MNTTEIQNYLKQDGFNVTAFAQRHNLALRTIVRIKAKGTATTANTKIIGDAIKKDLKKEMKK